jgi:hypothetical protein
MPMIAIASSKYQTSICVPSFMSNPYANGRGDFTSVTKLATSHHKVPKRKGPITTQKYTMYKHNSVSTPQEYTYL